MKTEIDVERGHVARWFRHFAETLLGLRTRGCAGSMPANASNMLALPS
jgi:hypothetical protein